MSGSKFYHRRATPVKPYVCKPPPPPPPLPVFCPPGPIWCDVRGRIAPYMAPASEHIHFLQAGLVTTCAYAGTCDTGLVWIATEIALASASSTMDVLQDYQDEHGRLSQARRWGLIIEWGVHKLYHITDWDSITPDTQQECHIYL